MAPTIRDVAKRAGVAVSTASLALNGKPNVSEETRQRVLRAARELDYHPHATAKSLADGHTRTLSLITPVSLEHLFSSAGFFARLLQGMHQAALEHNYYLSLRIVESEEEAAEQIKEIVSTRRADGLLITNPTVHPPYLSLLEEQRFPAVFIGHPLAPGWPYVDNDNIEVGRLGTAHLIAQGHKRVALLNGPERFTFCLDRLEGYRRALAEAGLPYREELVWASELLEERAYATVNWALADGVKFSAIFAVSDVQAVGALRALRAQGLRVPEDVALVCVNNTALAQYAVPSLTAIDLHEDHLGYRAVQLLLQVIASRSRGAESNTIAGELICRQSCGCREKPSKGGER